MDHTVDDSILHFFSQFPLRRHNKRHILLYPDDEVNDVCFLTEGTVKQYTITYRGDEVVLNIFKPGSFFPMNHVVNHTRVRHFFEAETDIEAHHAPADEVLAFIESHPAAAYDLLRRVHRGMEGVIGRMEQLMSGSAMARVVYELVIETRRFGTKNRHGSYTVAISEKDLGARSGLSRETVNREIHKLKEKGLIAIHKQGIILPDLALLEALLD